MITSNTADVAKDFLSVTENLDDMWLVASLMLVESSMKGSAVMS